MKTIKFLKDVRKEIEGGWTQGAFERENEFNPRGYDVCLVGAYNLVRSRHASTTMKPVQWADYKNLLRAYWESSNLIRECIFNKTGKNISMVHFNDAKNTKKKDVLEVIDCAIAQARKKELDL